MSYPARKVFRQVMACDEEGLKKSCVMARGAFARRDVENAMHLAELTANYDDNFSVQNFLESFRQR